MQRSNSQLPKPVVTLHNPLSSSVTDGATVPDPVPSAAVRVRARKPKKIPRVGDRKSLRPGQKRVFSDVVDTGSADFRKLLAVADKPYEPPKRVPKGKSKSSPTDTATTDGAKGTQDGTNGASSAPVPPVTVVHGIQDQGSDEDDEENDDGNVNDQPKADTDITTKKKDGSSRSAAAPIPLGDLRVGDVLSQMQYMKVTAVRPWQNQFEYRRIRGPKENDPWTVTIPDGSPFAAASASLVRETIPCTKTQLVQRLTAVKDHVFTVKFKPIVTPNTLADNLQKMQANNALRSDTTALARKTARALMDRPVRTLIGCLKEANIAGGYSLVDELSSSGMSDSSTCAPRYRQVNHREIVELICNGVCYQLKKK